MVTLQELEVEIARLAASGETLYTLAERCPFQVKRTPKGYSWEPLSTGKLRRIDLNKASEILQLFNATGSLTPSRYKTISFSATYYCPILARMTGQTR